MGHDIRAGRRARRVRAARTVFAVFAAGLIALTAACGAGSGQPGVRNADSPSSSWSSPGGSAPAGTVAYAACMRSHGVPKYPDPDARGELPKGTAQTFGVSNARYQAAGHACRQLLPGSGRGFRTSLVQCLETGDCPPAVVQRALDEGRTFAQCMRHNGVPRWPDPTVDSMGRPSFHVTAAGISLDSTRSPQLLSKIGHCQDEPGAVLLRQE